MINLMTKTQKDDFMMFSMVIECCVKNELNLKDEEREAIEIARNMVTMVLDSYIHRCTKELQKEILAMMKRTYVMLADTAEPIKQKNVELVDRNSLNYLIEESLHSCQNCKRNWKQCGLRKALHKIGAPMIDPEQAGCRFKFTK
jgi:hypothetical protein